MHTLTELRSTMTTMAEKVMTIEEATTNQDEAHKKL